MFDIPTIQLSGHGAKRVGRTRSASPTAGFPKILATNQAPDQCGSEGVAGSDRVNSTDSRRNDFPTLLAVKSQGRFLPGCHNNPFRPTFIEFTHGEDHRGLSFEFSAHSRGQLSTIWFYEY